MNIRNIAIAEYDYPLPDERIAYYPLPERNKSRLLLYRNGVIEDARFEEITKYLSPGDALVFNDSKVIHARLQVWNRNHTPVEIFCLEPLYPTSELSQAFRQSGNVVWKCMVGNAKRWKEPLMIEIPIDGKTVLIKATKGDNIEGTFHVTFEWDDPAVSFSEWIEHYGKMPLPPYIKRKAGQEDEIRYQTVYAHHEGSVAAPTAGLHFSEKELEALDANHIPYGYVTLHVGAGTFKPVTADLISDHYMHGEQMILTPELLEFLLEQQHKRIIAVGTTVTRSLESLFIMGAKLKSGLADPFRVGQWEYYEHPEWQKITGEESLNVLLDYLRRNQSDYITGSTQLMIVPGFRHKIVKGLFTNFHQPKSTLLLLIASFVGEEWKTIYRHALEHDYRFLSYGDANLYLAD